MSHADALFLDALPRRKRRGSPRHVLTIWHRRSVSRTDVARLDARGLEDIGLTRFEADAECAKPFWQA